MSKFMCFDFRVFRKNKTISKVIVIIIAILILISNFFLINNTSIILKNNNNNIQITKINNDNENLKFPNKQNLIEKLSNGRGIFIKNQGQLGNDDIYFTYSGDNINFAFCKSSVLVKISKSLGENTTQSSTFKIIFENSNIVIPIGKEELNHKSNYFISNDSSKWKSNVPNFEKVIYKNLYDRIDLIYYFNENGLKYDWIVKPYAEPNQIEERFEGINFLKIDSKGRLIIRTKTSEIIEEKPFSYQKIDDKLTKVETNFKLTGNTLSYEISDYATTHDLVIDPLIFSTFIGGNKRDSSYDIVLDSENNIYITGSTNSVNFPTTSGCFDETYNNDTDVFVIKLNSYGTEIIYSTFIGGGVDYYTQKTWDDYGYDIVLDSENNVYVTGYTTSFNFPTTPGCYDDTLCASTDPLMPLYCDIFLIKLNWNGFSLLYSTYIGESDDDYGTNILLDNNNNPTIIGYTYSSDFPTTPGCFDDAFDGGDYDIFALKMNSNGTDLLYSTFIGGKFWEDVGGIQIDANNNIYIAGSTSSSDFPTTPNCFESNYNGGYSDVFVLKLNWNCSDLLYSTFIGGSDKDCCFDIALDYKNNSYITGYTFSSNFPVKFPYESIYYNRSDAFVSKLNSEGTDLFYSTYLGGDDIDVGRRIVIDSENNAYIAGYTLSSDYPTTPITCYDYSPNGGNDIFISMLNNTGTSLDYSTLFGGNNNDYVRGLNIDSDYNISISGYTSSQDFPITYRFVNDSKNITNDFFVFKIRPNLRPKGKIESISPNSANEGEPVFFNGYGKDDGKITGYRWNSSIDGFLSSEKSFNISYLSNGNHKIYFWVKDNNDIWSYETQIYNDDGDLLTLEINGIPKAKINKINPNFGIEGEKVTFSGEGTDDGTISGYEWQSNIDGFLSSKKSFSTTRLSNGTHIIYFKVKDNKNAWSKEVTKELKINAFPYAKINEISPNSANENEEVWFYGEGKDDGYIVEYEWISSNDGFLSSEKYFSLSNLSNGTHEISFRVKDNTNLWSEKIFRNLTINGIPIAKIIEIIPKKGIEGEKIWFYGEGTDDGIIEEYYWKSSKNGFLSEKKDFNHLNLSNGTHTIYFKVLDNNDFWSEEVSTTLQINGIPIAKINKILPIPASEGEEIFFYGNGTDDGEIIEYYWYSNTNGFLSYENTFNLTNLSNGTHTIYFKVMDNNDVWSEEVSTNIQVKPILNKDIDVNDEYNPIYIISIIFIILILIIILLFKKVNISKNSKQSKHKDKKESEEFLMREETLGKNLKELGKIDVNVMEEKYKKADKVLKDEDDFLDKLKGEIE